MTLFVPFFGVSSPVIIFLQLRNRKHVPYFYRVIETRVEVLENENYIILYYIILYYIILYYIILYYIILY